MSSPARVGLVEGLATLGSSIQQIGHLERPGLRLADTTVDRVGYYERAGIVAGGDEDGDDVVHLLDVAVAHRSSAEAAGRLGRLFTSRALHIAAPPGSVDPYVPNDAETLLPSRAEGWMSWPTLVAVKTTIEKLWLLC
jgi:hypothetical protein